MSINESKLQKKYYKDTAEKYDKMHLTKKDEHYFALNIMLGMLDFLDIKSILDIGSGTGRVLKHIKENRPEIKITGIEPVSELREIGYHKGLSREELIDGNALKIDLADNSFDLVCEFGVLHHIKNPNLAVSEMLRVAKKGIFISDNNIYGDGSLFMRVIKQTLHSLKLFRAAYFIQTKGKLHTISEADGLSYHYSVYDSYELIRQHCSSLHTINTNIWTPFNRNLFRTASHIGLLGILKQ